MSNSTPAIAHSGPSADELHWGRATSWAFYDFANTAYSALVLSYAATLHLEKLTNINKPAFLTVAASMIACAFFVPMAGELSDRTGYTKRFVIAFTIPACLLVSAISFTLNPWLTVILLFCANFCYQASLPFYDSLLPTVAPPRRMGLVSGIGVGLGYGGVAATLPIGLLVMRLYRDMKGAEPEYPLLPLFALAGALYLLFAVPLMLFVPEKPASKPVRGRVNLLRLAARRVLITLRTLPRHKPVMLFLIGNFLCADSLNAGIVAASPFMVKVYALPFEQALLWFIPFTLCALILSYLGGRLTDRYGPKRTMIAAALSVGGAVTVGVLSPDFHVFIVSFMVLGGFGLSTVWVAGRRFLVMLVPPGQVGKYFGFYDVSRKLALVGLIAFGAVSDAVDGTLQLGPLQLDAIGHRAGLLCLLPTLALGIWLISRVETGEARGR